MPDVLRQTISATEASALFERSKPNDVDCWIWQGAKNTHGYGHLKWRGKYWQAHRLVYVLTKGNISPALVVDHLCRKRDCINPSHLEAVTNRENLLRGNGRTSAKKTCKRGHDITNPNNVRVANMVRKGVVYASRDCRLCKQIREKERRNA